MKAVSYKIFVYGECRNKKSLTFCRLLIFFENKFFRKIISGIPFECQTDWIQIRPNILLGLIWVQSVCKGYQQTTLGGKELRIQCRSRSAGFL